MRTCMTKFYFIFLNSLSQRRACADVAYQSSDLKPSMFILGLYRIVAKSRKNY